MKGCEYKIEVVLKLWPPNYHTIDYIYPVMLTSYRLDHQYTLQNRVSVSILEQ